MKQSKIKYCFNQLAGTNQHELYIYDDVTEYGSFNWNTWEYEESETSAKHFASLLNEIPTTDEIHLYINSYGGSVKEGISIYNQLKRHGAKKIGHVDGFAYSIAFVIFQACDERIMGEGTTALIHDMWVNVSGNAEQLRKEADDLDTMMEGNRKLFMARAKNITEDELKEMMAKETILTPDQCMFYGWCDEIQDREAAPDQKQIEQSMQKRIVQLQRMMTSKQSFREDMKQFYTSVVAPAQQETNQVGEESSNQKDVTKAELKQKQERMAMMLSQAFTKAFK